MGWEDVNPQLRASGRAALLIAAVALGACARGTTEVPTSRVQSEGDGGALRVDARDCEDIRAALIRRIEESAFEHRDSMLAAIRREEITIAAERISIGGWDLSDSDGWHLLYRTAPGPSPAYGADVEKTADGWAVGPVHPVFIHPRR